MTMHTIPLPGCTPTPLAAYLKALGVFRILSQQRPDCAPRAHWQGNTFILTSGLSNDELINFFLHRYRPSPILSPWNGDGGFFPDSRPAGRKALAQVEASRAKRFEDYRISIGALRAAVAQSGLVSCPEKGADKNRLLLLCRSNLPDLALAWFDATLALTLDAPDLAPLLGTGGNDGSMDFSNNYMQWLLALFGTDDDSLADSTSPLLQSSLFGTPCAGLEDDSLGQFAPADSGWANAATGFTSRGTLNPWDFVLTLEGALFFATTTVKRLESSSAGQIASPFCVRVSGHGYGSAAADDEHDSRCEMWMPLWHSLAGLGELETLFAEGRANVGRRQARTGLDFALAVTSLGVDRGVTEFQRYGFQKRKGKTFYAIPLQRVQVHRNAVVADLLAPADEWIQSFLRQAKGEKTPHRIAEAARRFETCLFAYSCSAQSRNPQASQELLISMGECERALCRSVKWAKENHLRPLPPLLSDWFREIATDDPEYRLAAALASLGLWVNKQFFPIRCHLEPVKISPGSPAWADWGDGSNEVVSSDGSTTALLCAIMRRRLLFALKLGGDSWREYSRVSAWPCDIAAFIEGRFDEERFVRLLWGLCLVQFREEDGTPSLPRPKSDALPPAFYGQLKLCFAPRLPDESQVPVTPSIFELAAGGDGSRASEQALRRLHASSVPVAYVPIRVCGQVAERSAAALLFPLWASQLREACEPVARHLFSSPANL